MLKKIQNSLLERGDKILCLDGIVIKVIVAILFVLIFVFCIYNIDSTPATQDDYKQLLEQKEEISKDFNSLYKYDNYSLSASPHSITVTLSNAECQVVCYFNENLELTDSEKVDNVKPLWSRVLVSILLSCLVCSIIVLGFTIILWVLALIVGLLILISMLFNMLFKRSV